ncbi:MAG: type IV secretory system conjugative DNA transfer family protein [Terracidiphilus sp.]|jgi:type IV secretion system protein VirD4
MSKTAPLYRKPMTPGYLGTYNWRSTLLGLLLILTTNIITTQHIAAHFDYQPALGEPLFQVSSIRIYAPYKWFVWILHFGSSPNPLIRQPLLYSTLITAIGFAAALFVVALLNIHQNRKLTENTEDLHGSARWANEEDIRQSGLTDQKHGVYIGAWHDEKADRLEYLKHAGPEHILAFAPTRSGKGVGLVIPTLLGWEESAVIFDIKGENWDRTAGYRVAAGHVCFRFAPVEEHSARFNPLAEVRIGTLREVSDAQNIAEMLCRSGKESSHDEHWIKSATSLITGLILHLCYVAKRTNSFATLAELSNALTPLMSDLTMPLDLEGMDEQQVNVAREYFSQIMRTPHVESTSYWHLRDGQKTLVHPVVLEKMQEMLNREDKEFSGVLSTAKTTLILYSDPLVQRSIEESDFTINDLKHFKYPVSLYLVVPPSDIERLKPLLRLIFTMAVNRLTEELEEVRNSRIKQAIKKDEKFSPRPDHRLLLLIDEFPSLGKMPIFETAFAYIAGYGIKAYLITQDIEQIKDAYGNHESIISNCHIRIAYAPNKTETAEALSKMAGTTTILRAAVSYSGSRSSPLATNVSTNVDHISRPLITIDELMRLPGPVKEGQGEAQRIVSPGAMLIFIAGQSPIFGKQLLYFQDATLSKRSAIRPPDKHFTIEHHGNILSPGTLHYASETTSTRGIIQGPKQADTPRLTEESATNADPASAPSATSGSSRVNSDERQRLNAPGTFALSDDGVIEPAKTTIGDDKDTTSTDEMKEVFEQLEVGMEEMDRDIQLYQQTKQNGAMTNDR